jgi:dCTP deaminase
VSTESEPAWLRGRGILAASQIEALAKAGHITAPPFATGQVQPASLDLRLGGRAWRMRASFLPGLGVPVMDRVRQLSLHEIDLSVGAVLETGCVYVAELLEGLALPDAISAAANPKSSTGRIDVFTRVIADGAQAFDTVSAGYKGPLFAEISPKTFPILARVGSRLSQIRFRNASTVLDDDAHAALHERETLVTSGAPIFQRGVAVSIDLEGVGSDGLIGYRAKRHTGLIDVDVSDAQNLADFWEPIHIARRGAGRREIILDPGEFYILASKEAVRVPPDYAAEMTPFDPLVGEFRVHYAGFFDPGFGAAEAGGAGSRAVLEVRSHDVPFILEDGQLVARLVYEAMAQRPTALYGADLKSNYQAQGLKLSKHFRATA